MALRQEGYAARITENLSLQTSSSGGAGTSGVALGSPFGRLRFLLRFVFFAGDYYVAFSQPLAFSVEGGKNDIHIFKHCTALDVFWHGGGLALKTCAFHASSLVEWVMEVLRSIPGSLSDLLFMHLWVIWTERNNLVWNSGNFSPLLMSSLAASQLKEFHKYHLSPIKNKMRFVVSLGLPSWW